jgi:glycosyltransferase involved in cell wall biosynthesis
MRIGLVIYGSLDTVSGGYLYDRMLVDYLQRQGDQVEIISLTWRSYPRHLADNLSPSLLKRLSQLDVDILLQDELNHPSLFWINHRLRARHTTPSQSAIRPPLISIVHHLRSSEVHPAWQLQLYQWVERRYLCSVDGFIYNSQATRRSVEALAGNSLPNIVALPPAGQFQPEIRPEEIIARANQGGPLRLLFVGNLIPRKGLHTLLAAIQGAPEDSLTLTVVGGALLDSSYERAIRQQIIENNLQEHVRLLGFQGQGELAELLNDHHVLVVPSSYEGFGIVYLEAMGFGLPAIGTTGGGAGEIITHSLDGYLVAPGDVPTLRSYLVELHTERGRLAQMGTAARRRYLAHPAWETTGKAIHSFLLDSLAKEAIA